MTKNVNALLDDAQYERLRKVAFETRRSMTDIIREALGDWLTRHEAAAGESGE